jgi:hypothetical protein
MKEQLHCEWRIKEYLMPDPSEFFCGCCGAFNEKNREWHQWTCKDTTAKQTDEEIVYLAILFSSLGAIAYIALRLVGAI